MQNSNGGRQEFCLPSTRPPVSFFMEANQLRQQLGPREQKKKTDQVNDPPKVNTIQELGANRYERCPDYQYIDVSLER
jgi:hypothetical protein